MNARAPFQPHDLNDLDACLLDRALAVVPMQQIQAGQRHPNIIGLRHDVDNVIKPAVDFARWEHERGYRSTYFILHTAPYWHNKTLLRKSLEMIADLGHEIGIHNNAFAASLLTGRDPADILAEAIHELRGYGHEITGTVAHGDSLCRDTSGAVRFVNDQLFRECRRRELAQTIGGFPAGGSSLADFHLDYDANWIGRHTYLSDSGGRWSQPFQTVADGFPYPGQLHMLVHPDWWGEAFVSQEIAA